MKKVIWLLVMLLVCSISYAESMKFITVLSSAVGTFNKLEAVDPKKPAEGKKVVNFCTSIGEGGKVELKGTEPAKLNTVALADTTTLGRTGGKYSLREITLGQGGNIKGGRLFGNTLKVDYKASGKADNLYGNELTVAGAKTKSLEITGASQITAQHEAADMVWSNEYQDDTACGGTSGTCKQQYLLKQKGTASSSSRFVPSTENIKVKGVCSEERVTCSDTDRSYIPGAKVTTLSYAREITKSLKSPSGTSCNNQVRCPMTPSSAYSDSLSNITEKIVLGMIEACPTGKSDEALCDEHCAGQRGSCNFSCIKSASVSIGQECDKNGPRRDDFGCSCNCSDHGYSCQKACDILHDSDGMYFVRGTIVHKYDPLIGDAVRLVCKAAE